MTEGSASRIAFLRDRVEAAEKRRPAPTFAVPFRQRPIDLTKIEVPIAFPLYNLHSGRTHRAQSQYIEQQRLSEEFFSDPESSAAQHAQHEILVELINQEKLAEDLLKGQKNPIVLTYDGYIVDGNRRIAALRHQGEVENVIAVVLPSDATASEIYETELELQMARQTKAEYNWVDEALHVRWGVQNLGEPIHAIAQRMNVDDKEIEKRLGLLSLVDLYLEWLGAPGKYHRVGAGSSRTEAAQAFEELFVRESRQQFKALPELQRRAIREACFTVIQQQGTYMDIRRVADSIRTRPATFVERLRRREDLPEPVRERLEQPIAVVPGDSDSGSSILDQLAAAENETPAPPGVELLNIVDDASEAPKVAALIISVAEELAEEEHERHGNEQTARKVGKALKLLESLELGEDTQRLSDISRDLAAIMSQAERLARQVEALRSSQE
jgi:hypothetical protein